MAERNNSPVNILVLVVVLAALAVAALAIVHLAQRPVAPAATDAAATAPPAAAPTIQREVLVPVVQLDTEALAAAVAGKVEAKVAARLEVTMKGLVAATPPHRPADTSPPVGGRVQRETTPVAAAPAPAPAAPAAALAVPEAPKMPPPPEGSYVTKFGAQPATGPEDAPVLVFILSDFQCPVCKRAADGLKPLLTEIEGVRWVFWNNPLDMHRRARPAAAASMAAFRQGRFWEYHDLLFENSRALEDADLVQYAKDLGLDMDRFEKDRADETLNFQFAANMRVANLLEARGTPSFVINGRKQVGWGSAGGIQSMVQQEVDATRALMAKGMTAAQAREERAKTNGKTPEDLSTYMNHMLQGEIPPAAAE